MPEEKKQSKKSKEEVLFPEVTIGKFSIKPWSFGILFEISEMLENILSKMEAKNIVIDDMFKEGVITWVSLAKLFTLASDEVLRIISITVGVGEDEIRSLDMQTGVKIAFTIFKQNKEVIKNALSSLDQ